jgi:hypothetical protein
MYVMWLFKVCIRALAKRLTHKRDLRKRMWSRHV